MSRQPAKRSRGSSGAAAAARTLSVRASAVPPEWRRVFSFARFNAVQTACLPQALETDSNLLLVAPTGCGKTVAMELALIRMLAAAPLGKAVYIAPLRSLCAERHRDSSARFGRGTCVALTGDDTLEVGGSIHARLAAWRTNLPHRVLVATMLRLHRKPEIHRVGQKFASWPRSLSSISYQRPEVGPTFGPTL
jgi:ATP-dependent helicase YprA (DUF1998 family)